MCNVKLQRDRQSGRNIKNLIWEHDTAVMKPYADQLRESIRYESRHGATLGDNPDLLHEAEGAQYSSLLTVK